MTTVSIFFILHDRLRWRLFAIFFFMAWLHPHWNSEMFCQRHPNHFLEIYRLVYFRYFMSVSTVTFRSVTFFH